MILTEDLRFLNVGNSSINSNSTIRYQNHTDTDTLTYDNLIHFSSNLFLLTFLLTN
jgi:hypothetical protein